MMRSKTKGLYALLITLLSIILCATSCHSGSGKQAGHRGRVTVSIAPQAWAVEAIGGDRIEVSTLIPQGANPESYEPTMAQMLKLNEGDAWLSLGGLGFEGKVLERVNGAGGSLRVIDVSQGVELLHGTHEHGDGPHHHEGDADPHIWSSVKNMRLIADNSCKALIEIDPSNKDYYMARLDSLNLVLDSLDREIVSTLQGSGAKRFVVWHPSLSYFARDYGLEQIALGMDNKELSAGALRDKIDHASRGEQVALLIQRDYDSRLADVVNKEIEARVGYINPLNPDWRGEMLSTARAIAGAK